MFCSPRCGLGAFHVCPPRKAAGSPHGEECCLGSGAGAVPRLLTPPSPVLSGDQLSGAAEDGLAPETQTGGGADTASGPASASPA